ncbi:MAG: hypothetical protein BWX77_00158 [Bacteroidetes bacterium ADurb.Bin090]|nr:MAG: hypothetical protein BWX77_00158 [Bacteroidetes bacterium ADurb.Bin090]
MAMPMVMEVRAVFLAISEVIKLTSTNTTKGFTLAYQPGEALSPIRRITYLGMVAYIWLCIIQNPLMIRISMISLALVKTLTSPRQISRSDLPSP